MSTITAVLVDDEVSNLKGLRKKIEILFPEIEILGCYQQPEKAIEAINKNLPQILFLDIQMPRIDDFELLVKLNTINFQVIFVTAYSEYAIAAFKQNATDYLLKPVANDDLKIAVNKAIDVIQKSNEYLQNEKLVKLLTQNISESNKIMIPTSKGISFIPQDRLYHLEGYEGYTKLHLQSGEVITSSYNLGKFQKILSTTFFKCHKSHIINLSKVCNFENEGYIILENQQRVPISKTNKKAFLSLF